MRKYILLLLLISGWANAQWSTSVKVDPFEGKRTTAIATGYGGRSPYNNPHLVFRHGVDGIEVYVGDGGSTACGELQVQFSFGTPESVIGFTGGESTNGDAIFLRFSEERLQKLVTQLKAKSVVHVEYITRCSRNRFKVSLRGSSVALSKIFTKAYYDKLEKKRIHKENMEKEKQRKIEDWEALNKLPYIENKLRSVHTDSVGDYMINNLYIERIMDKLSRSQVSFYSRPIDYKVEEDKYMDDYKAIRIIEQKNEYDNFRIEPEMFYTRVQITRIK